MTHIFLGSLYFCFNHIICKQIMTRKDCEHCCMEYYDVQPKKDGKEKMRQLVGNLCKKI